MRILLLITLFLPLLTLAQKKQITLEDIYQKGTFQSEVPVSFQSNETRNLFNADEVRDETGKRIDTRNYQVSNDKKHVLFFTENERIYRRSSKATAYLYDVVTRKTLRLNEGKILHATFSPDNQKIAYVFENNLYLYDIAGAKTTAVTTDGKWNFVINGNADWVYEEEFEFSRAFQWSPSSTYLAYYRFDESAVKEFNMTIFDDKYHKDYRYKY